MPSRRMIDPAFWQSESVATLPIAVRYFFIGLFSNADDQGRMKAHPALLRSKLYPYDDINLDDVTNWIMQLVGQGSVIPYVRDGKEYIQLANWWKYQHPRWAWPSEYPAPEGWTDRVHYRKGNAVVTENWQDSEPAEDSPADDGEPTVEPQWNQGEPTVEPAPSISISTSTSTRISTSTSTSSNGSDGEKVTAAVAAAVDVIGFDPDFAPELVAKYGPAPVLAWAAAIPRKKGIKDPPAFVRSELEKGHSPPPPKRDNDMRRYIDGEYAEFIQH